jgi:signal transduction histidine kinase
VQRQVKTGQIVKAMKNSFVIDDIIHIRPKQEILFNVSNFIGILILSYFGFFHWHAEHRLTAMLEFLYAGLGACVLMWVKFTGKIGWAQNFVLAILLPFFCLMMIEGGTRTEAPVWLTIYPLLAFFYKGKKQGSIWLASLILALLIVVGLQAIHAVRTPFPATAFMILIACLLTVAMYVYAYDMIRSEAEQTLKTHTLALDEANHKLVAEVKERQIAQQNVQERTHQLSVLNDELVDTVEKLARLNAEKNELLSMITHDLRNPLTGVLFTVKQLEHQHNLETHDNRKRISDVKLAVQYTMRLINNFLSLKAMEAGEVVLHLQPHNLAEIVNEVLLGYRTRAAEKSIEIVCHTENTFAMCDQGLVCEIVENLLSNAIKFSTPHKKIMVNVTSRANKALLTISDQGPGFTPEDKRKMFKMFTRLSAQPTGGEESIGLGLSTVKKLTELMSGQVGCESEHGYGAIFSIELPLTDCEPIQVTTNLQGDIA